RGSEVTNDGLALRAGEERIQRSDGGAQLETAPEPRRESPVVVHEERDPTAAANSAGRERSRHATRPTLEDAPAEPALFPHESGPRPAPSGGGGEERREALADGRPRPVNPESLRSIRRHVSGGTR